MWGIYAVMLSICLSVRLSSETRTQICSFLKKLNNLELWSVLMTNTKSYTSFSQNQFLDPGTSKSAIKPCPISRGHLVKLWAILSRVVRFCLCIWLQFSVNKCVILYTEDLQSSGRPDSIRKWWADSKISNCCACHICRNTINNTHCSTTNFNRFGIATGIYIEFN